MSLEGFALCGLFLRSLLPASYQHSRIKKPWLSPRLILFCREDRIRTCDPLVPNQVRYRPALLPELIRESPKKTPGTIFNCGGGGIRTRGTELPVRQFSKLLISATHPPHRLKPNVSGRAKLLKNLQSPKDLCNYC